ncbi:MAG TPA: U32 family peptidase, partial [Aquifex sp.]|nr:U32 family peptidase [Aquifex sp.]
MERKPEILAPAGSWESLASAIKAGADAVYFGLDKLNQRSLKKKFTLND